eukprot:scaffold368_cov258-Pinguiococcus_pyrenoidosus.AAC.26
MPVKKRKSAPQRYLDDPLGRGRHVVHAGVDVGPPLEREEIHLGGPRLPRGQRRLAPKLHGREVGSGHVCRKTSHDGWMFTASAQRRPLSSSSRSNSLTLSRPSVSSRPVEERARSASTSTTWQLSCDASLHAAEPGGEQPLAS